LLVGLGLLHYRLGLGADDPAVLRLRDAYLEAFSDIAPHGKLVEELRPPFSLRRCVGFGQGERFGRSWHRGCAVR
jgi:hypothetical protein